MVCGDWDFLGAIFVPKNEGFYLEVEDGGGGGSDGGIVVGGGGSGGQREEMDVEGAAKECPGPSDGEDTDVSVVEGGGEVGFRGEVWRWLWWWWWLRVVERSAAVLWDRR